MKQDLKNIIKIIENYSKANYLNEFSITYDNVTNKIILQKAPLTSKGLIIPFDIIESTKATPTEYKNFKRQLKKAINRGFLREIQSYTMIYFIESI